MDKDDLARERNIDRAFWHVGAVLMNWGRLETSIAYSIIRLDPDDVGPHIDPDRLGRTFEYLIGHWRTLYGNRTRKRCDDANKLKDDALALAADRNIICHGIGGIIVSPDTYKVSCWQQYYRFRKTGSFPPQRVFSKEDLTEHCGAVGSLERRLDELTEVAIAQPKKPQGRRGT